jgi:hypothetical protein
MNYNYALLQLYFITIILYYNYTLLQLYFITIILYYNYTLLLEINIINHGRIL